MKDYYAVLGIAPGSDEVVVRAAYKALMLKYHPDTSKASGASAKAAAINEAFSVLGDSQRRASYDAIRAARAPSGGAGKPSAASERSTNSSPPPPGAGSGTASDSGGSSETKRSYFGLIAVAIFLVLLLAISLGHTDSNSSALTSTDTNTANATADETLMGNDVTSVYGPPPIASVVTNGEPPPLQFKDIEAAANQFDRIFARGGMVGAKAYSDSCHKAASKSADWSKHDFCAGFDIAARYVDQSETKNTGYPPNAYFLFITNNAADQYVPLSSSTYGLGERLQSIKETVEPAVTDAIETRVARDEMRPKSSDAQPSRTNPGDVLNTE
jgi:curved DNA-binding protein CbpA